tara:strand:+ start:174 stop:464 length:291 start_codon:yes stop_codon:yes gene_type:complete
MSGDGPCVAGTLKQLPRSQRRVCIPEFGYFQPTSVGAKHELSDFSIKVTRIELFGNELRTLSEFGVLPTNPCIAFSHFPIGHPTEMVTQVIMDKLE